MKKLNEMQIKYLTTDTELGAEIETSSLELRSFISIFAYQYKEQKPFGKFIKYDKFIKNVDMNNVFFTLMKYEISKEHMEKNWDIHTEDLIDKIYLEDIKGIQNIEKELLKYLEDLSVLQPNWKCDNPL